MNEELTRILKQDQAVWAGDVVEIVDEGRTIGRVAWRIAALWGAALAILGAGLLWRDALEPVLFFAVIFVPTITGFYVWMGFRSRPVRQRLDREERIPAPTLGALARRLWVRSRLDSYRWGAIDAARWVQAVGPDGPRVILVDCSLLPFGADGAVFEEVSLGADQALGPKERKLRVFQLVIGGVFVVLGGWFWHRHPSFSAAWMAPYYGVLVLFALYRLGLSPVQIGASTALPGLVRTTRWFRSREFRRETSVLVIRVQNAMLLARFSDPDGVSRQFRFHGTADPALHHLISRWCWRNDAGAHWEGRWTREHVRFSESGQPGGRLHRAAEPSGVPTPEEKP